jgi:hypothetical protein
MNLLLSTLVLVAGLTQSSSGTASSQNLYQLSTSPGSPQVVTSTVTTNEDSLTGEPFLPAQAQETVLVVPTPDLPAESVAELTEDLAVMCRIFDKSLAPTRASTGFANGNRGDVFRYSFGQQAQGTQGLYLDGYGALFFVPVDYPLVPTEPQEPSEAKAKESADTVWSATVKEMSGQPGEDQQAARSAQTYDPRKVENVKKAAIKTLAHTSNIRMRRPQDVITLVLGALDDSRASSYRRYGTASRSTPAAAPMLPGAGKPQPATRNPTAAFLVMRVTKADVDAFAKGQLTAAQFTEKVQTISAPIPSGVALAPQPAPTPASAARR